ncbi:hydroxyisourate hydrolase [Pyxidicoccus caerfyrddinensis]|uniref:hydroxyisourate hydrolase n=1 Tax=Pyxidicoccus caerfyrddinensis TaxID=2709663 RepID=UPI0013DA24B5|nr:hydroxyisourate hydrolase [Pyxidicoccus caerfyrddinensis]
MGLEKSDWENTPNATPDTPSATESFAALDAEARRDGRNKPLGLVTNCPLPYFEVILQDASGAPLPGVPCELAFPEGSGKQGTTDANGRAHFPNVEVDASRLSLEITEDLTGERPVYRARVVPRTAEPAAEDGPRPPGAPLYYAARSERLS